MTATTTLRPGAPSAVRPRVATLTPLLVDVGIPLGGFYLLNKACGVDTATALVVSSVPAVLSALWTAVRRRRVNALAALVLLVNAAGFAATAMTGDARMMLVKDSLASGAVGLAFLLSVLVGRPLMSTVMRPLVVADDPARLLAWDRLADHDPAFRAAERRTSLAWGGALLAESGVRVVAAFSVPVATMVWLHVLLVAGAVLLAIRLAGPSMNRMKERVAAESAGPGR